MKCVQLAITDVQYVKCSHSYVQNTLQPHCQSMEHRSITIGMKLKVLIKCGTSCVGRSESKKSIKCVQLAITNVQ